ncbi:hypothetical protein ASF65_03870 [Aureimonas sp. Leaf324]|nr:hypothetical protein ASF65_03870 [Aureimonas sp. Leaf324]
MPPFAHSHSPRPSPTTWSFPPGHVFRIDGHDFAHVASDALMLRMRSLDTGIVQTLPQTAFDRLVGEDRVDPRIPENDPSRQSLIIDLPDALTLSDLPEKERNTLIAYTELCRRVVEKHKKKELPYTRTALRKALPAIMAEVNDELSLDASARAYGGANRSSKVDKTRRLAARTSRQILVVPAPSTVLGYIAILEATGWDPMQLRDRRSRRRSPRGPNLADPRALEIMTAWRDAYLDRSRPTAKTLYRLMKGGPDFEGATDIVGGTRPSRSRRTRLPHERVAKLPTFFAENELRAKTGLPPLTPPSLSTFERDIRKLPEYDKVLARYGPSKARRDFKVAGRHELAMRPGELVGYDSWRIQSLSKLLPRKAFDGLSADVRTAVEKLRLSLTLGIDAATRVVVGVRLSLDPNADTTVRALRMAFVDKTEIARAAGCVSTWAHMCSVSTFAMDGGPENIAGIVQAGIRDVGSQVAYGKAGVPDERGWLEAVFRTTDIQLLPLFQGRTFSGVNAKGEIKPEQVANLVIPVLQPALIRYLVDVYNNQPHSGLGGRTPNDAWIEASRLYGVQPPPSRARLRAAFGMTFERRIQNTGISLVGLEFANDEVAEIRRLVGQEKVEVRLDVDNLDEISARAKRPGSPWVTVPCRTALGKVSLEDWFDAATHIRRQHADVSALRESVVQTALADIRNLGIRSALDAGIGPSTMTRDQIEEEAAKLFRQFRIVPAEERGRTLDFRSDADSVDDMASIDAAEVQAPTSTSKDEPMPTTRRGRRTFSIKTGDDA